MNAKGRVEEAVSSLAWHETYEHSREHPEIIQRMREHTERAVQKLAEADGKGMLAGYEQRKEAKREAAAAKTEHEAAMREYEQDIIPERQEFEARNERKLASTARHARDDGLPESWDRTGLTESEVDLRVTPAVAGAPSRTRSIKRQI